jgi:protein SCO1
MAKKLIARLAGLALVALAVPAVLADTPNAKRLDPSVALQSSEAALGRSIGSYILTDTAGKPVVLAAYRGKPLVVSLVYTSCSSVCPATTQRLISAVDEARRTFGSSEFAVLTVGFDARNDTPARMAQFAVVQGVTADNWRLASGDGGTISALLHDLGFSYAAATGGFDHIIQTTIINRDGNIYRHVYGDDFPIQMFIEPLKDVIYGTATSFTLGGLLSRIKFICTTYDPGAGRYRIDYGLMFGSVIAALSLLIMGGLLVREWRRAMRA